MTSNVLRRLWIAVLLGFGLSSPTGAALAAGDVLRLGNAGEPETLDPHRYNLRLEETILTDLFLGLTTFDAEANIVPGAAEGWQVSEDGLTWTFQGGQADMRESTSALWGGFALALGVIFALLAVAGLGVALGAWLF